MWKNRDDHSDGDDPPADRAESTLEQLWKDMKEVIESIDDKTSKVTDGVKTRLKRLHQGGQRALRRTITGDADKRVRDHARDQYQHTKQRAVLQARKLVTGDDKTSITEHMQTTPVVKLIDRISFTLGVANFAFVEFLLLRYPQWLWAWFVPHCIGLLAIRTWSYVPKKWHFFMLDFCYYVNMTCILSCLFLPTNSLLWKVNFMHATGPLAVAIVLWRNSLVFHDLDKMSSVGIHALPVLLVFATRWTQDTSFNICDASVNECPSLTSSEVYLSFFGYFVWQMLQIFLTEVVFASKLADPEMETSIRWITRDDRNFMNKLSRKVCTAVGIIGKGEPWDSETWKTKIIFWMAQFVYTVATIIPGVIAYHNYYLNLAWIFFVGSVCIWNGASFYIEVFAVRYNLKFNPKKETKKGFNSSDPDSPPPRAITKKQ